MCVCMGMSVFTIPVCVAVEEGMLLTKYISICTSGCFCDSIRMSGGRWEVGPSAPRVYISINLVTVVFSQNNPAIIWENPSPC